MKFTIKGIYVEVQEEIVDNITEASILLIDNSTEFLNTIINYLEFHGFKNVIISTDPRAALEKCQIIKPFLIIMEYIFDDISGEELLIKIKDFINTSVIIVSGSNKLSHSFNSLSNGADSFIHKDDFNKSPKVLIDSVKMWLEVNRRESVIVRKLQRIDTIANGAKCQTA